MACQGKAVPTRRRLTDTGTETVRGIALVCAAYLLMALGDGAAKWTLPVVGVAGVMMGRGVFGPGTVVALVGSRRGGWRRVLATRWGLVALRSTVHAASSVLYYAGWQLGLTLADSYAIGFSTPLLMTVLAIPLLHERLRWYRAGATVVGFVGVLVMVRPGGELWNLAALVTVASIPLLAVSRILTRLLATTETPECLAFWLLAAHLPAGLLMWAFLPITGLPGLAVVALAGFGLCQGLAHWVHARAFALAPVGALAPYEYTSLLFGGTVGWVAFAELPTRDALLGAAIVVAAGLWNLHHEQRRRRAEAGSAAPP
jgi:drug/metabolite transporter (DMT)-like permease